MRGFATGGRAEMARRACGPPTITNAHAESHRVAKVAQGGRFEESRGVAESQHIAQASRLDGGGEVLAGPVRFTRADTTCDETMVARRRQARRGAVWQAWRR